VAKAKILVVDDEEGIRFGIRDFLETNGYDVAEAENCQAAQEAFRVGHPDIAVLDYLLPDGNALELLPNLKRIAGNVPFIILTGHGTIDLAVRAIKEGAEQFLTKPVDLSTLLVMLERLLDEQRNRRKQLVQASRHTREVVDPFLGESEAIRQLAEQAQRVIATEKPVLIHGETGSGKGVLARWLHEHSPRAEEAYVDVNCAGLTRELLESELFGFEKGAFTGATTAKPGLLEVAHRGTVFLDEIGDMDLQVQPKLLKVLEDKRFRRLGEVRDRQLDIRLIAATHQDLFHLISEKLFRSDLYFRISTIPLAVPPLRARKEDIPILARHLLARCAYDMGRGEVTLASETERTLQAYAWPGNIRELRNVLERAILLSDKPVLTRMDLRFELPVRTENTTYDTRLSLEELEQHHIARVLQEEQNHVERAAHRLGIPRSSLYQKIKKYQMTLSKT
jgi:DNA-binding NtrC family response regulator